MIKSIIISGPPAIGKTTIANGLAKEFDVESLSGGDILEELAAEQGFQTEGDDWWDTQEGINFLDQRKKILNLIKMWTINSKNFFLKVVLL